jgi:hypothetical protein
MTRDDFADRVSAALRIPDVRARRDALEPLLGYGAADDLAKTSTPVDCVNCGKTVPRIYTVDGRCAESCIPLDAPLPEAWERDIPF